MNTQNVNIPAVRKVEKKPHWQLTPWPVRSCWRKKRNQDVYYVGKGTEQYSESDYRRAWAEWEQLESSLEAKEREENRKKENERALRWAKEFDAHAAAAAIHGTSYAEVAALEIAQQTPTTTPAVPVVIDPNRNLGSYSERFLQHKLAQARTGQRSPGRLANLQTNVKQFTAFVGDASDPRKIDATTLADYYAELMKAVSEGKNSTTTASDKLNAARQFIRFLWSMGACELPRNLDSRELAIDRALSEIHPMPQEAYRERVVAARGRMKLELLLMANCGMYQGDCADLKHSQIDWKHGTITRKRSKNEKHKNAPTVTYYLWPSTLELLRKYASDNSPTVLLNRNGIAGVRKTINEDGKVVNTDNAASAYTRLQERLAKAWTKKIDEMKKDQIAELIRAGTLEKVDGEVVMRKWPLKTVRKMGATAIGNHKEFSRFAEYYLADTPQAVADRHYVRPSEEDFKNCLEWLGKHLDLDHIDKIGQDENGTE